MLDKRARLTTEVWEQDRCAGCGLCVAACLKGMLEFTEDSEHPTRRAAKKVVGLSRHEMEPCAWCDVDCAESCPMLKEWQPVQMGATVSVRTTRAAQSGAPNDVVTDILCAALANGFIDGAIVMDVNRWTLQPEARVVTSIEEIVTSSGNQYIWCPTLVALREAVYARRLKRIAVVGMPCAIQGLRALKSSQNESLRRLGQAVKLTVGMFCSGIYLYDLISEAIVEGMGVAPYEILTVRASQKGSELVVALRNGTERRMPLEEAARYTRKACARCDDFLAQSADLSVGTVGAMPGHSVIVTWTPEGKGIVDNAISWGHLVVEEDVDSRALLRAKEDKERRRRVQMFDSMSILMLDALGDPKRIEEARKRFGSFYNLRQARPVEEEKGGCEACHMC